MLNRSFTIAALTGSALAPAAALAAPVALAASTAKAYSGPSVAMRWGNVAVTITVSNNKVVAVRATYPTERPRSQFINSQAVPILRSEALRAQRATINAVSGATLTSRAFVTSLSAALKAGHV